MGTEIIANEPNPKGNKPGEAKSVHESASDNSDETLDASEASESHEADGEEPDAKEENLDEAKESKEVPKGVQKKIDKLVKQKADARREVEYWKEQVLKQAKADASKKVEAEKPAAASKDAKPVADDFNTHAEFTEALADWKFEQKLKERDEKEREAHVKAEIEKRKTSFSSKVAEFQKDHSDFEDAIESVEDIPFSVGIKEAIFESDIGPAIMYDLAKNRSEYERISKLGPFAAAKEIGKIEDRLLSSQKSKNTEAKKITKAPSPISPVAAKGTGSLKKSLDDENLSFAEYVALRRAKQK